MDLFTNRGTYLSRPNTNPYAFAGVWVYFITILWQRRLIFDQLG
jgi:hypothetical protein